MLLFWVDMDQVHKTTPFRWSEPRLQAALLCAEDDVSDEVIADRCGVSRKTLHTWRQHPDFQAQMGDHIGQIQAAMLKLAIAKKHRRLAVLDDLYAKSVTVIEERAAEYAAIAENNANQTEQQRAYRRTWGGAALPAGGETGLLVRQVKQLGSGPSTQIIEEFAVDTGLIKQIQSLQEQAAKELGQWVERSEMEQRTSVVQLIGVDPGDI